MKKYFLILSAISGSMLFGQTYTINPYATGLNKPVDVALAPGDDRFYVVEQPGTIRIVNTNGSLVVGNWLDITSIVYDANNEQGLLGLAFDPNYETNGYFYVNYTAVSGISGTGDTKISRFSRSTSNPNVADPASEVVLMVIDQPYTNHNGGCLRFGPDGYLYIGMGDGGSGGDPGNRAQNPLNRLGKMLRIDVNAPTFMVPPTNPYYNQTDTLPEIWAVGVRNPWKFNFDRLNGDMWMGDVGQDAYEEVDHQLAGDDGGHNYGWRCYEGLHTYNNAGCGAAAGYTMPIAEIPQASGPACSITGGVVYRGGRWGAIYGKYIFTDFCNDYFWETVYDTAGVGTYTTTRKNQVPSATKYFSNFVEDRIGHLYVCEIYDGTIYRITLDNCTPAASIEVTGPVSICSGNSVTLNTAPVDGCTYQWLLNGTPIGAASDSTYTATAAGDYQVIVTNPACVASPVDTSVIVTVGTGTNPVVTLTSNPDTACATSTSLALMASPAGGQYTSQYAAAGTFYPIAAGLGVHEVVYTYTNAAGCTSSDTVTIRVVDCTAGLEDLNFDHIQLYPNPAHEQTVLYFDSELDAQMSLLIMGMDGKTIQQKGVEARQGNNQVQISTVGMAPGIYFIRLSDNIHSTTLKIVVQ